MAEADTPRLVVLCVEDNWAEMREHLVYVLSAFATGEHCHMTVIWCDAAPMVSQGQDETTQIEIVSPLNVTHCGILDIGPEPELRFPPLVRIAHKRVAIADVDVVLVDNFLPRPDEGRWFCSTLMESIRDQPLEHRPLVLLWSIRNRGPGPWPSGFRESRKPLPLPLEHSCPDTWRKGHVDDREHLCELLKAGLVRRQERTRQTARNQQREGQASGARLPEAVEDAKRFCQRFVWIQDHDEVSGIVPENDRRNSVLLGAPAGNSSDIEPASGYIEVHYDLMPNDVERLTALARAVTTPILVYVHSMTWEHPDECADGNFLICQDQQILHQFLARTKRGEAIQHRTLRTKAMEMLLDAPPARNGTKALVIDGDPDLCRGLGVWFGNWDGVENVETEVRHVAQQVPKLVVPQRAIPGSVPKSMVVLGGSCEEITSSSAWKTACEAIRAGGNLAYYSSTRDPVTVRRVAFIAQNLPDPHLPGLVHLSLKVPS